MAASYPNHPGGAVEDNAKPVVREQDQLMPVANVIRIMRRVLPPQAKISEDAKELIKECVSEYISFITGEANQRCVAEQRKTVTAEDVVWAMAHLGFVRYVEPLSIYMIRYRESDDNRRRRGSSSASPAMPAPAPRIIAYYNIPMQPHMYGPPMPPQPYVLRRSLPPSPLPQFGMPTPRSLLHYNEMFAGDLGMPPGFFESSAGEASTSGSANDGEILSFPPPMGPSFDHGDVLP